MIGHLNGCLSVMNERYFAAFEFRISLWAIPYIAIAPWTLIQYKDAILPA